MTPTVCYLCGMPASHREILDNREMKLCQWHAWTRKKAPEHGEIVRLPDPFEISEVPNEED